MTNDSAEERASRSAVRPETLFRRGASPGGQTTGASGMDLLLHHAGKEVRKWGFLSFFFCVQEDVQDVSE